MTRNTLLDLVDVAVREIPEDLQPTIDLFLKQIQQVSITQEDLDLGSPLELVMPSRLGQPYRILVEILNIVRDIRMHTITYQVQLTKVEKLQNSAATAKEE